MEPLFEFQGPQQSTIEIQMKFFVVYLDLKGLWLQKDLEFAALCIYYLRKFWFLKMIIENCKSVSVSFACVNK